MLAVVDYCCWLSFVKNFVRYLVRVEMPLLLDQTGVAVVEVLHCEVVVVVVDDGDGAVVAIAGTTIADGGDDVAADCGGDVTVDVLHHRYFHHCRCVESAFDGAGVAALTVDYDVGGDDATDDGFRGAIDYSIHPDRLIVFGDRRDVNYIHQLNSHHRPNDGEDGDGRCYFDFGMNSLLEDPHHQKMSYFWCWN